MHIGPAEIFGVDGIIILVVVVLVLFGSTQIPKLARSLGSAQKEFKKGLDEGASEGSADTKAAAQAAPPPAAAAPAPAPPAPAAPAPAPPAQPTVEASADGSNTQSAS